jgi:hypothetical protein
MGWGFEGEELREELVVEWGGIAADAPKGAGVEFGGPGVFGG